MTKPHKSSTHVTLAITSALAMSLAGCSINDGESFAPEQPRPSEVVTSEEVARAKDDYVQICQDIKTGKRVPDSQCGGDYNVSRTNTNTGWYFIPIWLSTGGWNSVPSVGMPVHGGTSQLPDGRYARPFDTAGGVYQRERSGERVNQSVGGGSSYRKPAASAGGSSNTSTQDSVGTSGRSGGSGSNSGTSQSSGRFGGNSSGSGSGNSSSRGGGVSRGGFGGSFGGGSGGG